MELSIRTEYFNPKFLYINLNNRKSSFFNIYYRTPTIILNNLVFETPWMDAPFGICQYDNEEDRKKDKYYLDMSFNGYQYDIEIKNFYRAIDNIDNYVITFLDNHIDYLGIDPNQGYIYNRQIRYNKNNTKYPPTIKLKIFRQTTKIVDLCGNEINFQQNIPPGSKAQALISCRGLWSYDNSFGLSWKVDKVIIKSPTFLSEYPFLSDGEDNDDNQSETMDNDSDQEMINELNNIDDLESIDFKNYQNDKTNNIDKEIEIETNHQCVDDEDEPFDDDLVGSDLSEEEKKKLISDEITNETETFEEFRQNPDKTFELIFNDEDFNEERILMSLGEDI